MKNILLLLVVTSLCACEITVIETPYSRRDRVLGFYNMHEYSQTYNRYYDYHVRVEPADDYSGDFYIDNFYDADISVFGTVSYNQITIPEQIVDGYRIEGTGTIQGSKIFFSYSVKDIYQHTSTDFCDATARWEGN